MCAVHSQVGASGSVPAPLLFVLLPLADSLSVRAVCGCPGHMHVVSDHGPPLPLPNKDLLGELAPYAAPIARVLRHFPSLWSPCGPDAISGVCALLDGTASDGATALRGDAALRGLRALFSFLQPHTTSSSGDDVQSVFGLRRVHLVTGEETWMCDRHRSELSSTLVAAAAPHLS